MSTIQFLNHVSWQNARKRWPVLAALAFSLVAGDAVAQTYTITDLGTLGGANSQARGINDLGQVVGTAQNGTTYTLEECIYDCSESRHGQNCWGCNGIRYETQRAFVWNPTTPNGTTGTMTDLGTLGGPNSDGIGINQFGQVVGRSYYRDTDTRTDDEWGYSIEVYRFGGFLWTPPDRLNQASQSMTDLRTFLPVAINSSGVMIGGNSVAKSRNATPIGSLGCYEASYAFSINDNDEVVGSSWLTNCLQRHAFFWRNGAMKDLGTLAGDTYSEAYAINESGQVVGSSYQTNFHGFLFTLDPSGNVTSRVTLAALPGSSRSDPYSINNAGQVIGTAYFGPGFNSRPPRALLWDKFHGLHDLNHLIPSGSGWVLTDARGINDAGQIVGTGVNPSGQTHAFLLTPLPAARLILTSSPPNGQFRFTLVCEAGRSHTIQASTNLVTWTALTNFVSATGTNQFTDPAAPNFSRRFYRAVTP